MIEIILVKKEKNRIYKSEDLVKALYDKELFHNEKGKPYLSDGYISISDTKEYFAASISNENIGIDIEDAKRPVSESIVKMLHPKEREYLAALSFGSSEWRDEFFSIWTKKESYGKLQGTGLSDCLKSVNVLDDSIKSLLYSKKYNSLYIAATDDFEIVEKSYNAAFKKSAKEAGADILDMFGCSSRTLEEKLLKRGYSIEETKEAVRELEYLGFLNDNEYARFIALKLAKKNYSSKRIKYELCKKGISEDIARNYEDEYKGEDVKRANQEANKILLGKDVDDKLKQKLARKLNFLGYEANIIYDIINKL